MRTLSKGLAVLAASAATSVSALAAPVTLNFHFAGDRTTNAGVIGMTNTAITSNSSTAPSAVVSIDYGYVSGAFTNRTGSITFADASKVYFNFSGTGLSNTMLANVTGFYADAAKTIGLGGSGSLSSTLSTPAGAPKIGGQFYGTYNPVPEPASMAAMALGLSGFVARRKRGAR